MSPLTQFCHNPQCPSPRQDILYSGGEWVLSQSCFFESVGICKSLNS